MVTPTAAAIVLVPFPFSDLSQSKLRPALALADAGRNDWILCQITSKPYGDPKAIEIDPQNIDSGTLHLTSYARPTKLFTANSSLFVAQIATLKPEIFKQIIDAVVQVLQSNLGS